MARFRYSMQSILNIKLKMETQAKQAFSSAKARLDTEEEKLEALKERKIQYQERATELLSRGIEFPGHRGEQDSNSLYGGYDSESEKACG